MSDPIANSQLELACRLGAIDDILEALEDGADINCNGHSPIFAAVMANDRPVVEILVEKGADVSPFELSPEVTEIADIVNTLLGLAPRPEGDSAEDEIDAKQLRAFDRMIRSQGLGEPFLKKRGDEYSTVAKALQTIAAEECHDAVAEFLSMIEAAKSGAGLVAQLASEEELPAPSETTFDIKVFLDANGERIAELSARYVAAEELPGDLLKEYVKEMKKLGGGSD